MENSYFRSGFASDKGHPFIEPRFRNLLSLEDPTLIKASEPYNSTNWICHAMPPPHQPSTLVLNSSHNEPSQPMNGTKRFLVFDQSGDKTTMMLTSGTFAVPNFQVPFNEKKEEPKTDDLEDPLSPFMEDEDDSKGVAEDEMHEDTEELNALLFSDSDDCYDDNDEEASTGHSPSTMTDERVLDEAGEEVDSFAQPTKRQKLLNAEHRTTLNCDGKGSFNKDDAESGCGDGNKKQRDRESGSVCCGKRSRKGKLLETVSILQSIIPGSYGKDAIMVIDEAIHYLKTLKVKAKGLRLDPLFDS